MIKLKKVKPMFTAVITTANLYEEDVVQSGIVVTPKGTLKNYQTVLAIGGSVRDIKVGDLVSINPMRFAVRKRNDNSLVNDIETTNPVLRYEFDIRELNDEPVLLLQDRDIEFIVEEYEEMAPEKVSVLVGVDSPKIIC